MDGVIRASVRPDALVTPELANAFGIGLNSDPSPEKFASFLTRSIERSQEPAKWLSVAASLRDVPLAHRWEPAEALMAKPADPQDRNLSLMIWYGIEPLVTEDPQRALKLAAKSKIPLIRQFIARRIADLNKEKN